jgi:hypothetical protein
MRCSGFTGATVKAGLFSILYGKGNKIHQLGTTFLYTRIESAVKRVEFVSHTMSYIVLRGRWCNIVLNVNAPSEEKSDDLNERFY